MLPEEPSHCLMMVSPGNHQCCPAIVHCCPRISSMLQQQLGHGLMATKSSQHQCCGTIVHCCRDIGTVLQQQLGHGLMATSSSTHQCCETIVHCCRHIGTVLQQQLGHGLMATFSSIQSVLWYHRCLLPWPHRHRAAAAAGPRPHGHLSSSKPLSAVSPSLSAAATSAPCSKSSLAMDAFDACSSMLFNQAPLSVSAAKLLQICRQLLRTQHLLLEGSTWMPMQSRP